MDTPRCQRVMRFTPSTPVRLAQVGTGEASAPLFLHTGCGVLPPVAARAAAALAPDPSQGQPPIQVSILARDPSPRSASRNASCDRAPR